MAGKTTGPNEMQKAAHEHIGGPIVFWMGRLGVLCTLCIVSELCGRLARFAVYYGIDQVTVDEAVAKNMKIGKASAQQDIDLCDGKAASANVRPI